ncbi:MAG: response regulator transcription factor [Bacteroidota bacterium]
MYKFLIIDDHYILRQGLKKIIADAFEVVEFGEADNSEAAAELIHKKIWDLVILDINLPGRSGLDFLKDVQSFNPELPVLVLSMYEEDQMALRVIKAGARGYITKSRAADNLIGAIERVLGGNKYISETVAELLVGEYMKEKNINVLKDLSDREYFVLLRLIASESVTEISHTLALSVKTISTYRSRVFKKLGLKSNMQLMQFAKDNHLG